MSWVGGANTWLSAVGFVISDHSGGVSEKVLGGATAVTLEEVVSVRGA